MPNNDPFRVLQSIPAALQHLTISIVEYYMTEEALKMHLDELAQVLRLKQFAGLETLELRLLSSIEVNYHRLDRIREAAKRILKDWDTSGVLKLVDDLIVEVWFED